MHHIVLFGEVLADIFPDQVTFGGAPYNVTRHLHALQQHPVLISKTGSDLLQEQLFNTLLPLKIDLSGIQIDATYPTGKVTVRLENETHHFNILPNQAYDYINADKATAVATSINPSILYFGTLAQRNPVSSAALDKLLTNTSCPRFLDINLRAPWFSKDTIEYSLFNADFVKVSEEELQIIAQLFETKPKNINNFALSLIKKFNLTTLFVTCGGNGAWARSKTGSQSQVAGLPLGSSVIDTVGAGDAFSAMSILGILSGWTLEATLKKANAFAANICKVRGAAPGTDAFYEDFEKP